MISEHEIYNRPWGFYKSTLLTVHAQAKIITVLPHSELSLQKHLKREEDIHSLNLMQLNIINSLWSLLKPGGQLLYVTCSVFTEENDLVIENFKKTHSDVIAKKLLLNNNIHDVMHKTIYGYQLLPGTRGMDGFYFSYLEKAIL